jgi:hypothetical protein
VWDSLDEVTIALLRVNHNVLQEAASIFYARNHFNFAWSTAEEVASFFKQIGTNNASYIRYICIDFANFQCLDVALKENSISILASIRDYCDNLSTLMASLYSINDEEDDFNDIKNHRVVREALQLVHTRFKTISSKDIVIQVHGRRPDSHVRREMQSYGWILNRKRIY